MKLKAGEIGIDEISEKVKRASELIEVCKAKLFQTEQDVDQILKNLEQVYIRKLMIIKRRTW